MYGNAKKFSIIRNILIVVSVVLIIITSLSLLGVINLQPGDKDSVVKSPPEHRSKIIGVIISNNAGSTSVRNDMKITSTATIGGINFFVGLFNGKEIVLGECDSGKVSSSLVTSIMLSKYDLSKLIFIGTAKALTDDVKVSSVVIASDIFQFDYGVLTNKEFEWSLKSGIKFQNGKIKTDDMLCSVIYESISSSIDKLLIGPVITGDIVIDGSDYAKKLSIKYDAIVSDSESASVALVSDKFDIPIASILIVTGSPFTKNETNEIDLAYRYKLVHKMLMDIIHNKRI